MVIECPVTLFRSIVKYTLDYCDDRFLVFVLPESQDRPSGRFQGRSLTAITLRVPHKFRTPVGRISGWLTTVNWAGMPETAIDKDGDPPFGKHDVGSYQPALDADAMVLAKPVPEPVKGRSECHLRLRINSADGGHVPGAPGRRLKSGPSGRRRRAIATAADHAVTVRPGVDRSSATGYPFEQTFDI